MTNEQKTAEAFQRWFKGEQTAVAYCLDLAYISHLWDDLIDKDKQRTDEEINNAFMAALFTIPTNPFFRKYESELRPLMASVVQQWEVSNVLEIGDESDREKAYMLRAGIYQIFHYCAQLVGGLQWGRKIGPEIYRFYEETVTSYQEVEDA